MRRGERPDSSVTVAMRARLAAAAGELAEEAPRGGGERRDSAGRGRGFNGVPTLPRAKGGVRSAMRRDWGAQATGAPEASVERSQRGGPRVEGRESAVQRRAGVRASWGQGWPEAT